MENEQMTNLLAEIAFQLHGIRSEARAARLERKEIDSGLNESEREELAAAEIQADFVAGVTFVDPLGADDSESETA